MEHAKTPRSDATPNHHRLIVLTVEVPEKAEPPISDPHCFPHPGFGIGKDLFRPIGRRVINCRTSVIAHRAKTNVRSREAEKNNTEKSLYAEAPLLQITKIMVTRQMQDIFLAIPVFVIMVLYQLHNSPNPSLRNFCTRFCLSWLT